MLSLKSFKSNPKSFSRTWSRKFNISYRAALDKFEAERRFCAEWYLFFGMCWPERSGAATEPEVWARYSDTIIEDYASAHPGRRPRLWWKYDAPEPREKVSGAGVLAWSIPERSGITEPTYHYGCAIFWTESPNEEATYIESEATYLQRHDLLLEGELERLTESDFKPERLTDTDEEGDSKNV